MKAGVGSVRLWLALAAAAVLAGCATTHSLTPVALDAGPAVRQYKSPGFNPFRYATFSVFPLSAVNGAAQLKGDGFQRPILFAVRNILEARGYRFVPMSGSPDFAVGVDVAPPVKEKSLGKVVVAAPEWTPGSTLPVPLSSLAGLRAADTYGWGTMPPPDPDVPPLPAYPPRHGLPGPEGDGYYLTRVTVAMLDGTSLAEVWAGTGAGAGRVPDIRINSQLVLWAVLHQFPPAAYTELAPNQGDVAGLEWETLTNDGLGFYPAILNVATGSPAWKGGALPYDMVVAVGGEPARNKSWTQARRLFAGPPDSPCSLTLWRDGRQVNVQTKRSAAGASVVQPAPATSPLPRGTQEFLKIPRTGTEGGVVWAVLGGAAIAAVTTVVVLGSR